MADHFESRPNEKVIGIPENDPGIYIFCQLVTGNGFYAASRAYRHENGGLNFPMIRAYQSGPRR